MAECNFGSGKYLLSCNVTYHSRSAIMESWRIKENRPSPEGQKFYQNFLWYHTKTARGALMITFLVLNPPEAIRNLVTPVATPRSVRPGFFKNTFCTRTYKAIPQSHRPVFPFNTSDTTTVCRTGFFLYFRFGRQ